MLLCIADDMSHLGEQAQGGVLLSPINRWEKRGTETLTNLLEVTQLASGNWN